MGNAKTIYDFIIIGAGIVGCATGYHLKKQNPSLSVGIIDQFDRVGGGNTSKSAALYRNLFSSKTSRLLANSSIDFYYTIKNNISLRETGYVWLFSEDEWKKIGKEIIDLENFDIDIKSGNSKTIDSIIPGLQFNYAQKQSEHSCFPISNYLYSKKCGNLSAIKLTEFYAEEFKKMGGEVILNCPISKFNLSYEKSHYPPWEDIQVESIMAQNSKILAHNFISAVGAWTQDLLLPMGIAPYVYPKKRQLYALKLDSINEFNIGESCPAIILSHYGIYIKPVVAEKILVIGCAQNLGTPFSMTTYPVQADGIYYDYAIKPVVSSYFPKLTQLTPFSKWAGYYAYYTIDSNPVIDKIANLIWVSGTSGSGIMKADAIGRITSALALKKDSVDLFDGSKFNVHDLSLSRRHAEHETLVI